MKRMACRPSITIAESRDILGGTDQAQKQFKRQITEAEAWAGEKDAKALGPSGCQAASLPGGEQKGEQRFRGALQLSASCS